MKRMTYLCRIGRTSLGLPRQAKADMSIKTAQLPALCLLNQYGIKKLSTVSDNKSKKCLVKSGKDTLHAQEFFPPCAANFCYKLSNACYKLCNKLFLQDRKKYQAERKIYLGERRKCKAYNFNLMPINCNSPWFFHNFAAEFH